MSFPADSRSRLFTLQDPAAELVEVRRNYQGSLPASTIVTSIGQNGHLPWAQFGEYPIPEAGSHLGPRSWPASQVCGTTSHSMPSSVNLLQAQYDPTVGRIPGLQMALRSPLFSSDQMSEMHGNDISRFAYSTLRQDSNPAVDPPGAQRIHSLDGQLLLPHIEQEIRDTWYRSHRDLNDFQSFLSSPRITCDFPFPNFNISNSMPVADPLVPGPIPLHHSSSTPPSYLTANPVMNPHFPLVPPRRSSISSRRRPGARAIEYYGLWIDEEELLKGLTGPNGMLNVIQCRWDMDRSPCHLWIKGDKSSINAHIQRWHGVKPGGDKIEFACRWSGCGRTMLKESISRHVVCKHLGEMWECQGCGKEVTREDAYTRHAAESTFAACQTTGALVTYTVDIRTIDARAALNSGEGVRYADA